MVDELQNIRDILSEYKQEHLLNFYGSLSEKEKLELIKEIETTDFEEMKNLYENSKKDENLDNRFSPIAYIIKNDLSMQDRKKYIKIGEKSIRNNELAVVTMAGGQGSRLGINGPKGTYELCINERKISLFEIIYENIKRANEKYNVKMFWLIMTSRENYKQTRDFFESENYFGYDKDKIIFFMQNEKPILNIEGKLVLENKYTIKKASNGNGNVFEALNKNNLIKILKSSGVKYISFGGVDNILVKPIDPLFLGLMINNNYQTASKSIFKEEAMSKTAVFCMIDNKPNILGYNYITEEISNLKDDNGRYLYRDENILEHIMTLDAIELVSKKQLKYHRAFRKNAFLDTKSKDDKIITEDSFKFEKFIFDAFSYFDDMLLLRVDRNEEFAPIKNPDGENSPQKAIELYNKYWNSLEEYK